MPGSAGPSSPRSQFGVVSAILAMLAVPAGVTLHTAKVAPAAAAGAVDSSPHGYTVSLLLFVVPILTIGLWLVPLDGVSISKKAFARTIAVLFPLGVVLDFFFAHLFLTFPNAGAVLPLWVPVFHGRVPIEEYMFYFTGFMTVLLLYIWLDEYWVAAYGVPSDAGERVTFGRLLRFHPAPLVWAAVLIAGGLVLKGPVLHQPGFPGYFVFLVVGALLPASVLFPEALPVINWRAFSLTLLMVLLTSLLWEATLAMPYRWWGYQERHMVGIFITAWWRLPIEAVLVWVAVVYETVIAYEIIRRWQASGRGARHAFFGPGRR